MAEEISDILSRIERLLAQHPPARKVCLICEIRFHGEGNKCSTCAVQFMAQGGGNG